MKAKNVSVSVVPSEEGVKVWNTSFTLRTSPPKDEAARRRIERAIAQAIEAVDFSVSE